jgi:hypothetical protein
MAKKKSFVLRMDPETFKSLEKWAADEFRSLNGQIEYLLHQNLKKANRHPRKKDTRGEDPANSPSSDPKA